MASSECTYGGFLVQFILKLFLTIFALSNSVFATDQPIDLKAAVELAQSNSPVIREAIEVVNQNRFEKYVARSGLFPKIGLSGGVNYQKDSVANKSAGSVPFGGNPYNLYSVGLQGEQTLLAYGFFSAESKAAIQQEIANRNLEIAKRNLTRDVILVFYKTLMNEGFVRILEQQEKGVRDILAISQRRLSIGGKRIDVLQVKTRLALLKPQIDKARNDLSASTAELAHFLGRSDAAELKIHGQIPSLALKTVEPHLNFKDFQIPELNLIRLQKELLDESRAIALGKNLPQLKAVGDYKFLNYTKSELFDPASKSWSVQLVLSVPLFSGFSSISERRALASNEAQLEAQERNLKNALSLEQVKRRKELELAETSLVSAEEAAQLAEASLKEGRREYRVGLIDFLQFFQIESANFEAATSLLQLRYNAIGAYSNYFIASGQPLSILVELLNKGDKT